MPGSILVPAVFTKALCQPVEPLGLQNTSVITYKYFHEVLWCELHSVHLQPGCDCGLCGTGNLLHHRGNS